MKNKQHNLEKVMTIYIKKIEELYQYIKLNELCQYFIII